MIQTNTSLTAAHTADDDYRCKARRTRELMTDADDNDFVTQRHRMPKLTKNNHETWFALLQDYIRSKQAKALWDAYKWGEYGTTPVAGQQDPADIDYAALTGPTGKKLAAAHEQIWCYTRQHLSSDIFQTTLHANLDGSVPKLLRHLRKDWHDNTTLDRCRLRSSYLKMKLDDYETWSDLKGYIVAYKNKVQLLREYKIEAVGNEEDVLTHFEESLGEGWKQQVTLRMAMRMGLSDALEHYVAIAKVDTTLGNGHGLQR